MLHTIPTATRYRQIVVTSRWCASARSRQVAEARLRVALFAPDQAQSFFSNRLGGPGQVGPSDVHQQDGVASRLLLGPLDVALAMVDPLPAPDQVAHDIVVKVRGAAAGISFLLAPRLLGAGQDVGNAEGLAGWLVCGAVHRGIL